MLIAIGCAAICALLLYVAAPHQQMLFQPLSGTARRSAYLGAAVIAALSLAMLLSGMGVTTALFSWVLFAMLFLASVPFLAAALRWRRR